jgi:Prealbumin-like fold domain
MTAVRKELRRRRKPLWSATVLVALAATLVFAFGASSTIGLSNFEAVDGNLKVDTVGNLDWANVNELRQLDATGPTDNSFGQGTSEDDPVPTIVTGSVPPNKSDLKSMSFYALNVDATHRYIELAWSRVQEPTGTTNMDFEFNKSSELSANGVTPVRTAGDALIQYDLARGGQTPTLFLSRWVTSGPSSQCVANSSTPCWGNTTASGLPPRVNLTAAGIATGSINLVAIPAGESDGLGALSARTFGEAEIDLSAFGGGGAGTCAVFGSGYLKSRSSASFNSEVKDFVPPEALNLNTCGSVIIRKVTDPASDPTVVQFGYTKAFNTDPSTPNTFSLGDGQSKAYNGTVLQGNGYTVVEDTLPAGWEFVSVDCAASSGVTPSINGATVTFDINDPSDVLDCTYHNRARGTIIVEKITDDGFGAFNFTSGTLTPSPFTLTTTEPGAAGADDRTFGDLVPGLYDVAETIPAGWNLVSFTCSDGSTPLAISLQAGETVTCTAHNARERGAIDILKLRKHAASGPDDVPHANVTFTVEGGELPAGGVQVVTDANGQACVGNLLLGNYTVTESVPSGYHVVSTNPQTKTVTAEATCSTGSRPLAEFHNMPLTNVRVEVDSQIVGGTASVINCGPDGSANTDPVTGDGFLAIPNKEPSVVTCTITIDP